MAVSLTATPAVHQQLRQRAEQSYGATHVGFFHLVNGQIGWPTQDSEIIVLHPPLPSAGVAIGAKRGVQQHNRLEACVELRG